MTEQDIKDWLNGLELNAEQKVLAGLALALAKSFDDQPHTSTAAELRKTVLELQRQLASTNIEVDPLDQLLKR